MCTQVISSLCLTNRHSLRCFLSWRNSLHAKGRTIATRQMDALFRYLLLLFSFSLSFWKYFPGVWSLHPINHSMMWSCFPWENACTWRSKRVCLGIQVRIYKICDSPLLSCAFLDQLRLKSIQIPNVLRHFTAFGDAKNFKYQDLKQAYVFYTIFWIYGNLANKIQPHIYH